MNLVLDIIVIMALSATIWFCTRLNKKIKIIQSSKKELAILFSSFDNTISKAEKSIAELKITSSNISDNIKSKIDNAENIMNNLAVLNQRASVVAEKMEEALKTNSNRDPSSKEKSNETKNVIPFNKGKKSTKEEKLPILQELVEEISKKKSSDNKQYPNTEFIKNDDDRIVNQDSANHDNKIAKMLKDLGYGE